MITLISSIWAIPPRQTSAKAERCTFGICLLVGFDWVYCRKWEAKAWTKCTSSAGEMFLATTGQIHWVPASALWHTAHSEQHEQCPPNHTHLWCQPITETLSTAVPCSAFEELLSSEWRFSLKHHCCFWASHVRCLLDVPKHAASAT